MFLYKNTDIRKACTNQKTRCKNVEIIRQKKKKKGFLPVVTNDRILPPLLVVIIYK